MMKDLTAAIDDAYHIPDVRIWLREYQADNIAQGCRLGAEAIRAAPSSVSHGARVAELVGDRNLPWPGRRSRTRGITRSRSPTRLGEAFLALGGKSLYAHA